MKTANELLKIILSIPIAKPEYENDDYDMGRKDYRDEFMHKVNYKSECCNADVTTNGTKEGLIIIMHYVCSKCKKPCDIK